MLTTCKDRVYLSSIRVEKVLGAVYKLLEKAYPEWASEWVINPALETEFTKTGCMLKIDNNKFMIQFTNENSEKEVHQMLSGNFKAECDEMQEMFDFFKDQKIVVALPDFQKAQNKKATLSVA